MVQLSTLQIRSWSTVHCMPSANSLNWRGVLTSPFGIMRSDITKQVSSASLHNILVTSFGTWLDPNRTPNTIAAGGLPQLAALRAIPSCPTSENKMTKMFFLNKKNDNNLLQGSLHSSQSCRKKSSLVRSLTLRLPSCPFLTYMTSLCTIPYPISINNLSNANAEQTTAQMASNDFHMSTTLEAVEVPATSNYQHIFSNL